MTSGPDWVYIEHWTVHLSCLMAHTSWAPPPLASSPESNLTQLAGTLFSNHPQAPVSPPQSYQGTQLHSIIGHRRSVTQITGPLYVPSDWGVEA